MHDQSQEQEIRFLLIKVIDKNHFKKQKYWTVCLRKIQNLDEIFYCGMIRLRKTNLDVFMKYQHKRTLLRKKHMGQSLFKKH